jgi:hypothetical protein
MVNNRPMGENSLNLVTLVQTQASNKAYKIERLKKVLTSVCSI